MAEHTPVTDEAVRVAQAADDQYATVTRPQDYRALSEGRVQNLLEAAAPLIVAAERERIRQLARSVSATVFTDLTGDGIPFDDLIKTSSEEGAGNG